LCFGVKFREEDFDGGGHEVALLDMVHQ